MEKIFYKGVCGILEHETFDEIVIMVHGYSSHKNTIGLVRAVEILKKLNISSLRIDLDNRGESDLELGKAAVSDYVKNLEKAIEYVKSKGYDKIDLVGTSNGGMVCMAAALKHKINKIFLRAPSSNYPGQRDFNAGQDYVNKWKENGVVERTTKEGDKYNMYFDFYEDSKNYIMKDQVKDITCPVQIIHGDQDDDVPLEHSKELKFPNGKLHVIKGASHNLSVDGDYSEGWKVFEEFFSH